MFNQQYSLLWLLSTQESLRAMRLVGNGKQTLRSPASSARLFLSQLVEGEHPLHFSLILVYFYCFFMSLLGF